MRLRAVRGEIEFNEEKDEREWWMFDVNQGSGFENQWVLWAFVQWVFSWIGFLLT